MATKEQLAAMKAGDVFYYRGKRFQFVRYNVLGNGMMDSLHGIDRRGHWTFPVSAILPAYIRIVPASKVRSYKKRKQRKLSFEVCGRPANYSHEKNDCTVRALATCTGIPYSEAHAFMSNCGRKHGKGFSTELSYLHFQSGAKRLQVWSTASTGRYRTVGQWLLSKALPQRCIIRICGHVFAVVNNTIIDNSKVGARSIVKAIFELIESQS